MNEQWPPTKLGDVICLEYGKPLPKEDRDPEGVFPVYGANGEKARANKFYHSTSTIIVGRKGSAGELNLTEEKFWPLDVTYFVTFDEEKYEMKFLYYLLQTLNLPSMAKGVKPGINRNDVYAIEVRIPPKKEQQRIVDILDVAVENIENRTSLVEHKLLNLKELFLSVATNIFSQKDEVWTEKNLGEICEILDKLRKPITKKDRVSGEYPYYGATGIVDYVDGYIFDEKLILIGEDGAKWGSGENTAFAVEGKCWVNNHAHVIRPNRSIVLDNWLIYYLNISDLTEHITGMTVPKLNQGKLREIQIPIAPLNQQQHIVDKLHSLYLNLELISETCRSEIISLIELKQSILKEAFNGKLAGGNTA
jgi:type I restriction enzyme, S subunit